MAAWRSRLLWVFALLAVACAKGAAPASAPPASPEGAEPTAAPPPAAPPGYGQPPSGAGAPAAKRGLLEQGEEGRSFANIGEAERALDQSRSELDAVVGIRAAPGKGEPGGAADATPLAAGDSRCERACKAFASMQRAAEGVCRLAGENDSRCTRARSMVKDSEARVLVCKCEGRG